MLVLIGAACGSDGTSLSTESTLPTDSTSIAGDTIATSDSTALPPTDSAAPGETIVPTGGSALPGIPFGSTNLPAASLTTVHTGSLLGGPLSPSNIVSVLTAIRSKGGRIVVKLCKGHDLYVKNADGTFSLTKWKGLIDQYRSVNLAPFIADGTILGHYLIDEPHRDFRWGGQPISQATIEAMAAYSKQVWPTMPTLVRVVPSWLAAAPTTYTHLDAGWLQYVPAKGEVTKLVTAEIAAAKQKGLGLVIGLNVMDGGNGSSKIPGLTKGKYAMSATELRTYGTALLNQSYGCGFYMWTHNASYYGRPDIKAAMAELSVKAKAHAKTSCRQ